MIDPGPAPEGDGAPSARDARRLLAAQQELSSLLARFTPPADLFPRVLATVGDALAWGSGELWEVSSEGGELRRAATWDGPSTVPTNPVAATGPTQLSLGEGLPGRVWASRTIEWLARPPEKGSPDAAPASSGSALAVPLLLGDTCEGVMTFLTPDGRRREEELEAWLLAVGGHIAHYLDRWRTHETLVRRDRALAAAVNGVVIGDAALPGFPLIYANPGFERLTGYGQAEVLGRPCSILQGPDTDPEAMAEIAAALGAERECRTTILNYRKDGSTFWNEIFLSPVRDAAGRLVQYVGVQNDVTDRHRAEEQVKYLAFHDPLTGLANRALLAKVVDRALERARRFGLEAALLFLDLDDFKRVNDEFGHAAGDELLQAVARRLETVSRPGDLLARQGGDEFLLLLADVSGDAAALAERIAEEVAQALARPLLIGGVEVPVRASLGISAFPHDAGDAEALLQHADAAMYRAKGDGGRSYRLHPRGVPSALVPEADTVDAADVAELDALLSAGTVRSVYQSIVDLESGDVLGYEALARGPAGSLLERPDRLFATARAAGRLLELDWLCRTAALEGADEAGMRAPLTLFVNAEPEAVGCAGPPVLEAAWRRLGTDLDVVVEITERALTARPAELLHAIEEIRERGWGIALDDVGADVRSLALMPLLRPDVIKLDLRLVQEQPTAEIAEIVNAVNAQRERTGALILAEGIETETHLQTALAFGASLGQGWYFSRPAALPSPLPAPSSGAGPAHTRSTALGEGTPYGVVSAVRPVRRGDKRLLIAISKNLEQQAGGLGEMGVIISAFQSADRFTAATHRRYTGLATEAAFVGALGVGMAVEPAPGVRGAVLSDDDPLLGEWSVAVLGPHFAAALVAIDLGDDGPDGERRFDFALTYERDLVIAAANALLERVVPLPVVAEGPQTPAAAA